MIGRHLIAAVGALRNTIKDRSTIVAKAYIGGVIETGQYAGRGAFTVYFGENDPRFDNLVNFIQECRRSNERRPNYTSHRNCFS
jgi:uncharacterized protein YaaQ